MPINIDEIVEIKLYTKYKKLDNKFFVRPGYISFKTQTGFEYFTIGIPKNGFLYLYQKTESIYKLKLIDEETPMVKTIIAINKSFNRHKRRMDGANIMKNATMIENIPNYISQLEDIKNKIQEKLDNMAAPEFDSQQERYDEVSERRESQIECLDSMIQSLQEAEEYIEEFDSQWKGIKGVR